MFKLLLMRVGLAILFRLRSIAGWIGKRQHAWRRRLHAGCVKALWEEGERLRDVELQQTLLAEHKKAQMRKYLDFRYGGHAVVDPGRDDSKVRFNEDELGLLAMIAQGGLDERKKVSTGG